MAFAAQPSPVASPVDFRDTVRPGAWFGLVVLTLINLFNYLDRFVLPAITESIKASELAPSDAALGFMATAFIVVYMIAAPFFGAAGDRVSRPRLLSVGIAVWSVATALGGLVHSTQQLLVARAMVGIGEAAYATIAPALLADLFPTRLRGRVFAIFFAALPVGSALGYVLGGFVDSHWGWRDAFYVAGVPGVALAVLALWVADPPRGAGERDSGVVEAPSGFASYAALARNGPYAIIVLGYAAYTFALGGIGFWMPAFLQRVHGLSSEAANLQLGKVLVVTGLIGSMLGGWIGDRLLRYTPNAYLWLSGITTLAAAPFAWIAFTASGDTTYFVTLVIAELLIFASTAPINGAIVNAVPPTMRAAAMALCILIIHLLGDVPSPPLIGMISDHSSLGRAVLIIPVAIVVSGVIWILGAVRRPTATSRGTLRPA